MESTRYLPRVGDVMIYDDLNRTVQQVAVYRDFADIYFLPHSQTGLRSVRLHRPQHPTCDMRTDCWERATMIDDKGFIYCECHGLDRRAAGGRRCRKLRPHEIRRIERGELVKSY